MASVLVVEDEWMVRRGIVDILRDTGLEVLEAASGEAAVGFLNGAKPPEILFPAVLFTDIKLGGALCGWDVAEAFREAHPEIGVIYTSGAVNPAEAGVARQPVFRKAIRPG